MNVREVKHIQLRQYTVRRSLEVVHTVDLDFLHQGHYRKACSCGKCGMRKLWCKDVQAVFRTTGTAWQAWVAPHDRAETWELQVGPDFIVPGGKAIIESLQQCHKSGQFQALIQPELRPVPKGRPASLHPTADEDRRIKSIMEDKNSAKRAQSEFALLATKGTSGQRGGKGVKKKCSLCKKEGHRRPQCPSVQEIFKSAQDLESSMSARLANGFNEGDDSMGDEEDEVQDEEDGEDDEVANWEMEDLDDGDVLSPGEVFGVGSGGRLSPIGLHQAVQLQVQLSTECAAKNVDAEAGTGDSTLLPGPGILPGISINPAGASSISAAEMKPIGASSIYTVGTEVVNPVQEKEINEKEVNGKESSPVLSDLAQRTAETFVYVLCIEHSVIIYLTLYNKSPKLLIAFNS